jgi:hypothetical protein
MVRVTSLLEKIGLVYSQQGQRIPATEVGPQPVSASEAPADISPGAPPPAAPPVPEVRLDESMLDLAPAAEDWALEQVYASAGIREPAHGFTVYRLIEMLESSELRDLDPPTRAKVIAGLLKRLPAGAVEIEDIIRDAAARDRALDAFEKFLAERVARQQREVEEKNRALQQEIDELTITNMGLQEENRAELERERAKLDRWRERKQAEEQRLFDAVAPFASDNPVSK